MSRLSTLAGTDGEKASASVSAASHILAACRGLYYAEATPQLWNPDPIYAAWHEISRREMMVARHAARHAARAAEQLSSKRRNKYSVIMANWREAM